MKTSDSIKTIAPALVAAQAQIRFAVKDSTNPHFKSKYANINSTVDAIKPALNDNGIAFIQSLSPSDDGKLHLTTRLLHSSGEWLEDTAVCPLQKQDAQGVGSCVSYLRRYSLTSMLGLYSEDDDGNSASEVSPVFFVNKINQSATMDDLQKNYMTAMDQLRGNTHATHAVIEAKNKRKAELNVTQ